MTKFFGTGVALVTPFRSDFSVDENALTNIVNYVIDGGVEYLVVLGTTAESATLSTEEKEIVKSVVIKANNGRVPIVLGVGSNNTAALVNEIRTTDLSDFDAVLSVSPYYNKPSQEGIYQHFKAVSQASPKPIIIYNVPGRTASNIAPETVFRLANDFENIIGIKEAAGDIVQAMRLIEGKPEGFLIISGDDMIALPMTFLGGAGVISVIGQGLPVDFTNMIRAAIQKDVTTANALHYKIMESIDLIFEEGNPAGIKTIFDYLGLSTDTVRLPLVQVSDLLREKINTFMKHIE